MKVLMNDVSRETFRLSTPADAPLIQKLAERIWWQVYPSIIGEAQLRYMLERMYALPTIRAEIEAGVEYVLLSLASRPVGFYALEHRPETARLHKLYLDVDAHGQGLGQRMIAHAAERARDRGARFMDLTVNKNNQRAIRAYKRAGFKIVQSLVLDIGQGYVMDDYRMCLPL